MQASLTSHLSATERCTLESFCHRLHATFGKTVATLRLFGSRARGEGDEESDLDVLVLTTEIDRQLKEAIWDIANDLLLETDIQISPLVMSVDEFATLRARERRIALDIEREGIAL